MKQDPTMINELDETQLEEMAKQISKVTKIPKWLVKLGLRRIVASKESPAFSITFRKEW